jgi:hypothetical protein
MRLLETHPDLGIMELCLDKHLKSKKHDYSNLAGTMEIGRVLTVLIFTVPARFD